MDCYTSNLSFKLQIPQAEAISAETIIRLKEYSIEK